MPALDLNLIRTFLHLYETRSVTRTAELTSVTQPAVSHALGRLRKQLNDQLFSRTPRGLTPTQRAEEIYPLLNQAIEVIESTIDDVSTFHPATSRRRFRILATDLGEVSLMPPVLRRIAETAPHIDLHITPLDIAEAESRLRQGQVDAVICTPRITARDIDRDELFSDVYCGIRAARHPRITDHPTLEAFLAERHIAVEAAAGHTHVDQSLERAGHIRDVALRISHFAALPHLVESSTYLSIIPATVSAQFCATAEIATFDLPFTVPSVEISIYTYRRQLPDPGVQWLRQTIREALHHWGA